MEGSALIPKNANCSLRSINRRLSVSNNFRLCMSSVYSIKTSFPNMNSKSKFLNHTRTNRPHRISYVVLRYPYGQPPPLPSYNTYHWLRGGGEAGPLHCGTDRAGE